MNLKASYKPSDWDMTLLITKIVMEQFVKYILPLSFLLVIISSGCFAGGRAESRAYEDIKNGTYKILLYGEPLAAEIESISYGGNIIKLERVAGCVVEDKQVEFWNTYNSVVQRELLDGRDVWQLLGEETAKSRKSCFYLDRTKVQNTIMPVVFISVGTVGDKGSILLDKNGLFQGDELICQWSLNGGNGTKEQFSLDGDFAVPILDTSCEAPFTHEYTGVGFGDWYLTICGMISGENLYLNYGEQEYHVLTKSLVQWTKYTPGEFPLKGDKGD